jgi:NADPH2:quinone reductase
VNFVDVYFRTGAYPGELPLQLGTEAAGTVAAVGEGVTGVSPGDRIAWAMRPGAYATRALVDAAVAVPIPAGVSDEVAAAVLLQGMTAHYLTTDTYPVQPGDTVLVHAGAGGTGALITQFAVRRGGTVLATTSTEEKAKLAREAGAAEVIRYDQADVAEEVARLTGGAGVAAVYDGVGASTFDASLASLRPRGYLVLFGASSGPVPPVDPRRLQAGGSLFLTRPTLAHYMASREELLARSAAVFDAVASGELAVRIGGRYPLDEVGRAHADLESRRTTGKLIIDCAG